MGGQLPGSGSGPNCADGVFAALAQQGVRCCLWRGTARVDAAFAGTSDFDLLVHREDSNAVAAVLMAAGCRRAGTRRPDVGLEDWFGLAAPSGPLLHFHVHYRLVAGEPRLNRYRLPWEQHVLDTRVPGARGMFVADPVVECALLLVRCSLQLRLRDRLPCVAAGPKLLTKVRGDLAALTAHGDVAPVRALLRRWLGGDVAWPDAPDAPLRLRDLFRLRRQAAAALAAHAAVTGPRAVAALWGRDLRAGLRRLMRRLGSSLLLDRSGIGGGLTVALTGGDDGRRAGLADALGRVFAGKFDVLRVSSPASPRALRARSRGMLVICDAIGPGAAASAADLVLAIEPGQAPERQLEALLGAVWRRF